MDINDWRALITVLAFLCFLGIVAWAYSRHAKSGFDEAARIPFLDEPDGKQTRGSNHG
jgi:cytochrome c oxidase cbb3-type subunit 4